MVALFRRSDEIQLLSHVRGFDVLEFEVGRVFGGELLLTDGDQDLSPISLVQPWQHGAGAVLVQTRRQCPIWPDCAFGLGLGLWRNESAGNALAEGQLVKMQEVWNVL